MARGDEVLQGSEFHMEEKSKRFHLSTLLAVVVVVLALGVMGTSCHSLIASGDGPYSKVKLNPKNEPFFACLCEGFGYLKIDSAERTPNFKEESSYAKYDFSAALPEGEAGSEKRNSVLVRMTKREGQVAFSWAENFYLENGDCRQVQYGFMYLHEKNMLHCQGMTGLVEDDWHKGLNITDEDAKKYGLTRGLLRERGASRLRVALDICAEALNKGEEVDWFENVDYFSGITVEDHTGLGYAFE